MKRLYLALVSLLLMLSAASAVLAQEGYSIRPGDGVQEFTGVIKDPDREEVRVHLYEVAAGDVIYAVVEVTSGSLDPYLLVTNPDVTTAYVESGSTAGNIASLLYKVAAGGDYILGLVSVGGGGSYRLRVGINAPIGEGPASAGPPEPELPPGPDIVYDDSYCRGLQPRPTLSGRVLTRETPNFIIHYTTQGVDAATPTFVEQVARALEETWQYQIVQLGWPVPPADCGEGGDRRFDVYLLEILDARNIFGYAQWDLMIGNNPNTTSIERYAMYGHLAIDNDFAGMSDPIGVMRATVAHEFFHNIQMGFDITEAYEGLVEGSATWMELQTFPQHDAATGYVDDLFNTPGVCPGGTPSNPNFGTRIYAEWLMIDSIVRDHGPGALYTLWRQMAILEGPQGFATALRELNTTMETVIERMAVRNLLLDYAQAGAFRSRVRLEGWLEGVGKVDPRRDGVKEMGVAYIEVSQPGAYTLTTNNDNLRLIVVGVESAAGTARVHRLGTGGTVDTRPYDHAYVIVMNTRQHTNSDNCAPIVWSLNVADGSGSPPAPPDTEVWDASQFLPPR